jgi:hypothetical protein
MQKVKRDIRIFTIGDIYERYLLNGYANIELPKEVDEEKQKALIEGILHNVPMPPLVIVCYYNKESFKLSYQVVQGKEYIELLLDFIHKNEKQGDVRGDVECFDKNQKQAFWHYQIAVHYIATELTEEELDQVIKLYESL